MKPLKLRLSGLQSYREQQEIDFERLCETGVFGIFGPTGSGKSSILDAMTLALYGKVERAASGTQGIMNQGENKLAVSFSFELSGAGEIKRYRVERQFKRSGEVTVSNTLSRFVEITAQGEAVLADKLADVTRAVEERIGLNMQDFTRAVVLPQGKFAEFLSLTGKDRRQMLQRLFRLERFGDGLALKLNLRLKASDSSLQEALAEQQGLGNASSAAVAEAAERFQAAGALAAEVKRELDDAEKQHAERLDVRERQEALRLQEAEQSKLIADAPRIAKLEQELTRLAAAERVMPVLDAAASALEAQQLAVKRREAAVHVYEECKEKAETAAAAWTAAAAEASDAEPKLAQQLERLGEAVRLENDCALLAEQAAETERRGQEVTARISGLRQQLAKSESTEQRAIIKQDELKVELKLAELTSAERERRSLMSRQLLQLEGARARLEAVRQETLAESARLAELTSRYQVVAAEHSALVGALAGSRQQLLPFSKEVAALEEVLLAATDKLPAMLELSRKAQAEEERAQLAERLAAGLREGAPCPVCGSCEHPNPHVRQAVSSPIEAAEAAMWEGLQLQTQRLLLQLSPLRTRSDAALQRLADDLPDETIVWDGNVMQNEAAAAYESAAQHLAIAEYHSSAGGLYERFVAEATDAIETFGQQLNEHEERIKRQRQQLAELSRRCEAALAAKNTQAALHAGIAGRENQQRLEMDALLAQWSQAFGPEVQPEQAQQLLDGYEAREKKAEELRVRIERSVTFIEDTKRQLVQLREQLQETRLAEVELQSKLDSLRQQLQEKNERLGALTGGSPARQLIQAVEQQLAALKGRVKRLQADHEAAQQSLQAAAESRSAALEGEQAAVRRQQETAELLQAAMAASPFEQAGEVASLRPLLAQQEAMIAEAAKFREQEQHLQARLALLRDQLAGRSVTEEEWQVAVDRLGQAKVRHEAVVQQAAKSERDWEELNRKNIRWEELETVRSRMEALSGRLKALQTVFRGNAFVEYVAEEQLVQVCRAASERLGFLTKRRYALEVDSGGGFVIRDDANGGLRRPVSTLSGGETFLASLALALALSGQIQLRGKYPLQFFFLDEGFGTLDPELLETVITALEKLHHERLAVGVISHVPELRARLPRRLIVTAAEPSGQGSSVLLESM
ncbi:AAA family ATPase [Paenibacillus sp. GCM10027626]|uniref:AAA family ATPase n=1 Tax=Paenibacillus sp. GCM10027626 TaxID=3273411 RepID=UPI0036408020